MMLRLFAIFSLFLSINAFAAPDNRVLNAEPEDIKRSIVAYAAGINPMGDEIEKNYFYPFVMRFWIPSREQVFFASRMNNPYIDEELKAFLLTEQNLIMGREKGQYVELEGRRFKKTKDAFNHFATQIADLNFDLKKINTKKFKRATYSYDAGTLHGYIKNYYIVGGRYNFSENPEGFDIMPLNQSIYVTTFEDSLIDFVKQLSDGKGSYKDIIQSITDFVTNEINNTTKTFTFGDEQHLRVNEIILRGEGDPGNKAVLFASLLSQLDIPSLIVFGNDHVFNAVPARFFPDGKQTIEVKGKAWVAVDTTVKNFKVGKTDMKIFAPTLVQIPGERNRIYDLKGGRAFNYR